MPDAPATVTIERVELLRTGKWAASTGPVEITAQHLADMVAAEADPEIDEGPLKLGHTGALSKLGDSEPGLGWARNLETQQNPDGTTSLFGDLADIPAGIEPAVRAGFPRRSAEIAWGVKTPSGKTYSAVLDGLALLGVQPPAVKGLADLGKLYAPAQLAAHGLDVEARSCLSFYDTVPGEPTDAQRAADCLVWARKAAAELGALVGLTGLQAVFDALDAMVPADGRGLLAAAPHHDPVTTSPTGGQQMTTPSLTAEQLTDARSKLGLAADATEEQVVAKLSELDDLVTAMRPAPATQTETAPEVEPELEPAALSAATIAELAKAGLTVLPTPALEQLQAGAAAGAEAATHLAAQRRDTVLDAAEQAGKFGVGDTAKTVRTTFAAQLDKDFDGTKAVLDALPSIVPLGELGSAGNGPERTELSQASNARWDAWEAEVFGFETPESKDA